MSIATCTHIMLMTRHSCILRWHRREVETRLLTCKQEDLCLILIWLGELVKSLMVPQLLKVYLLTICTCGGAFVLYTYLSELLVKVVGFSQSAMGFILLAYGGCAILGNLFGGRLTDSKGSITSLKIILLAQFVIYALISITYHWQWILIANLCLMGFVAFAGISPLKLNAMDNAKKYTPDFTDSTVSVNEASFNVGIALANQIGGLVVITANFGITFNPLFAAMFVLPALIVLFIKS